MHAIHPRSMHLLPLSILILTSLSTAQAYDSIGIGPISGPAQFVPSNYYTPFNQHPNATSSFSISAVNTSASDPHEMLTTSWRTLINVTDIPLPSNTSTSTSPNNSTTQSLTNTVISFLANDDVFSKSENETGWNTCLFVMEDVASNATLKGQDDSGSCEQVLGSDCVGNLTSALQQAVSVAAVQKQSGTGCAAINLGSIMPVECVGSLGLSSFSIDSIQPNDTTSLSQSAMYISSQPHSATNFSDYDAALQRIWPIALIQSPSSNGDGTGFTHAGLSCLRAKDVVSGSRVPPTSASSGTVTTATSTPSATATGKKSAGIRVIVGGWWVGGLGVFVGILGGFF